MANDSVLSLCSEPLREVEGVVPRGLFRTRVLLHVCAGQSRRTTTRTPPLNKPPRLPRHLRFGGLAGPGAILFFNPTAHSAQVALSPTSYLATDAILPEPTSFEIFDYLDRSLSRLERTFVSAPPDSEFALKQAVVNCFRNILYRACDSRTVFPQLAPDGEGGLVAVWHAGELMIQIYTDAELHSEILYVRGGTIKTLHVSGDVQGQDPKQQESIGELRSWLLELSKHVNKNNPGWQRLFSDS